VTNLEMRRLARSMDLAGIRYACGFSCRQVARALGTHRCVVWRYEQGLTVPGGELGNRYMRIVLAMRNHLESTREAAPATEPAGFWRRGFPAADAAGHRAGHNDTPARRAS
jgi:hypothetical protein